MSKNHLREKPASQKSSQKSSHKSALPSFLQDAPLSEIADFITSHLHGLHAMVGAVNWPEMAYYLEMALIEAEKQAKGQTGRTGHASKTGHVGNTSHTGNTGPVGNKSSAKRTEQSKARKLKRRARPLSHPVSN